ncbi:reverse transcriptase domain-containing protein [Tanacetum coccineum]|uniref:Reverse transcriptase domain-containing protein n=1 Tax=Tanacetum coccineum TaxID=301880 RepID=A0ABQ5A4H5_9ASTR
MGASFAITHPALTVDNFEIKGQFLHMILNQCQFSGALGEDVNDHIDTFLGICELFKIKDVDGDAIKLRVFPFTLTGTAKEWLKSNAPADVVSEIATLTNQMAMFNKKFDKLNATIIVMQVGCKSCGGPNLTRDCDDKPMSPSEDACWVNQRQGNFQASGSNSNTLSYKQGSLPSNTETNSNPHVNAVTTRSGKQTSDPPFSSNENVVKPEIAYQLACVEALSQMPKYVKFLKDLLTNKKKLEDLSTVIMSEECSAILDGKLSKKMSDLGSFTIPCLIGNLSVHNALANLGASINLMSYSLYAKLGLGEPKPTRMTIQLTDTSIKYLRGIIENVLVKVDRFVFPVDFAILDMDEDSKVPLILDDTLYYIDTIKPLVEENFQEIFEEDLFDTNFIKEEDMNTSNEEVLEELAYLIENDPSSRSKKEEEFKNDTGGKPKKSFEEPMILELKDLLPHLENAFLKRESNLHVIISSDLTRNEKEKLIEVLKANKETTAYDIKYVVKKEFKQGDRVLLFNSRLKIFPGKLRSRWSGPFKIKQVFRYGTVQLTDLGGGSFKVNGHQVKHYLENLLDKDGEEILGLHPKDN